MAICSFPKFCGAKMIAGGLLFSTMIVQEVDGYMMNVEPKQTFTAKRLKSLEEKADEAKLDYNKDGYDGLSVGDKIDKLQAMIKDQIRALLKQLTGDQADNVIFEVYGKTHVVGDDKDGNHLQDKGFPSSVTPILVKDLDDPQADAALKALQEAKIKRALVDEIAKFGHTDLTIADEWCVLESELAVKQQKFEIQRRQEQSDKCLYLALWSVKGLLIFVAISAVLVRGLQCQ